MPRRRVPRMPRMPRGPLSHAAPPRRQVREPSDPPGRPASPPERPPDQPDRPPQGDQQEGGQIVQDPGPELPHGPQGTGGPREEERRAADGPYRRIAPQDAVGGPQEERGPVGQIQGPGQGRDPPPEGTDQVVEDPGARPQQDRPSEEQELRGDPDAHVQPNRRLKRPPSLCAPSS